MISPRLPATVRPALERLQQMLRQFHEDVPAAAIPLEFWKLKDDDVFYNALQYVPCCLHCYGGSSGEGFSDEEIEQLPIGWRVVMGIFDLEEEFDNDGWTAVPNLGEEGLTRALRAYALVDIPERVAALKRVLEQFASTPEDEDAYSAAAGNALEPLIDDELASRRVIDYLRRDTDRLFGVLGQ